MQCKNDNPISAILKFLRSRAKEELVTLNESDITGRFNVSKLDNFDGNKYRDSTICSNILKQCLHCSVAGNCPHTLLIDKCNALFLTVDVSNIEDQSLLKFHKYLGCVQTIKFRYFVYNPDILPLLFFLLFAATFHHGKRSIDTFGEGLKDIIQWKSNELLLKTIKLSGLRFATYKWGGVAKEFKRMNFVTASVISIQDGKNF